jgi:hypothetical protein
MEYYNIGVDLLTNPKHSRWVTDCLLLGETVLCTLVIWKVPCKPEHACELTHILGFTLTTAPRRHRD